MEPKIGFIGLGTMGRPVAANLIKAGYQLTVFNRTTDKAQKFAAATGSNVVASPAEAARISDVVIILVSDSSDVEEVAVGQKGIIEGAHTGLIVIDMSTISPEVTKRVSSRLQEKEVEMLDAPVSGGEKGAIEGTLTIMVGGKQEVFDKCVPIFQVMGETISYMGETGAGQVTKLCNQILCSLNLLGICEGLLFAAKAGLDLNTVIKALSGGSAQSWMLSIMGPKIVQRDFQPGFLLSLEQKDLRLALEAARENGISLLGTSIIHQLYNSVESEEGGGMLAHIALVKALEKLAEYRL